MKQLIAATLGFGLIVLGIPAVGQAADQCPPELTRAKAAFKSAQAPLKTAPQVAKGQEIQAPRSPQEIPVARGQEIPAPRVKEAGGLVQESEAACPKGDMTLSTRKAGEALGLLKK
jgi:hypothetical protein